MNQWRYKKKEQNDILSYFSKIKSFFDDVLTGIEEVEEYSKRLQEIATSPEFSNLADLAARKIINYQSTSNARTWREAAKRSSKSHRLYKALVKELKSGEQFENLVAQSAYQIRTLPLRVSSRIVKRISNLSLKGKRPDSVAEDIKRYFPVATKADATLIARTQIAKTYAAINQVRAQSLGVRAYIWHTVGGPLVRDSHKHMDNVIVFYDDPPSPEVLIGKKSAGNYHAGGIYNCRCYMEPILDIDDITWPHKVYYKGTIKKMGKRQFINILG